MVKIIRELIPNEINGIRKSRTADFFQDNNFNELLMGFKKAIDKHNTSVVMIIDGRSGMGKTTLALQSGITLDPDFGLHKIHFSPRTFLAGNESGKVGLAQAKKGDFILFDEAMLISNRSAMSQINKMIIQAMSMIRSKNIFVGFCVNSIFDLDRNLVLHRADALFHVYGDTLISRGKFCGFFKGRDGFDRLKSLYLQGKKLYDYSKPQANMIAKFPSEFIIDEMLYETEKQKGIDEFLKNKGYRVMDKRKAVLKMKAKGLSQHLIADCLSLSGIQVRQYLNEAVELEEMGVLSEVK